MKKGSNVFLEAWEKYKKKSDPESLREELPRRSGFIAGWNAAKKHSSRKRKFPTR